ncbi:MAG: glycerophosphodiester phosphodiesterase [Candidatus Thorarchaeota archaeon]
MNKTFIWGHRGAGFAGVQNTLSSFQNAIDLGVDGIKTEAKISKDREIFLTFEQRIKNNGTEIPINELESHEIKNFKLENGESIPTLRELFTKFKNYNIRYNFDINTPEIGLRIIEIAKDFNMIDKIEIAKPSIDPRPLSNIFSKIREFDKDVKLVNSIFLKYPNIDDIHFELESMKNLDIRVINVNYSFANFELFKNVIKKGFEFYIWGIIFNRNMERFLKMNFNGKYIDAMMSNFPGKLVNLRNKIQVI